MEREIKAIETEYAGYKFRSRTEARWAVFFDTIGFKWQYEEEGYELPNGRWYLPDFKVIMPNEKIYYCEIKPIEFDHFIDAEIYDYRLFVKMVDKPIIILTGQPSYMAYHAILPIFELPEDEEKIGTISSTGSFAPVFFQDYEPYVRSLGDDNGYWFHVFPMDENTGHFISDYDERVAKGAFGKKYVDAIKAAKMERFDKR